MKRAAKALWMRVGSNWFEHALRVAVCVLMDFVMAPVNRAIYYSLRLMFIDRLSLDQSFDFASFMCACAREHLAAHIFAAQLAHSRAAAAPPRLPQATFPPPHLAASGPLRSTSPTS